MSGSPLLRIQLLGTPRATIGSQSFPLSSVLLRLAASHPQDVRREELLESLYPEVDATTARNRLRVALARLRQRIELVETPDDRIGLSPETVKVDLHDARQAAHAASLEPEVQSELSTLRSLMPAFSQVLFPHAESDWQMVAQTEWSETALLSLERLADLAEQTGDYSTAAAASEAILTHTPYGESAWRRYLSAMSRAGRAQDAELNLAASRRRARKEGVSFPDSLAEWIPSEDSPSLLGPDLTPGENQVLERFFRRALVNDPELVINMLGSPSFRPEVMRAPRAVLPLLREALNFPTPPSQARERVQVRIITALSSLDDHEAVIQESKTFLAQPIAPARRRIALMDASFAHAMTGQLDLAIRQIEEAASLVEGEWAEYDAAECRAQRATYLMLAGDLNVAESEYRACLKFFDQNSREGSEPSLLSIRGNLGLCLAHRDQWADAEECLVSVSEAASALRIDRVKGIYLPVLGWVQSQIGTPSGSRLAEGIKLAFHISPRRAILAAAYAGLALRSNSHSEGNRVIAESASFRAESNVPLHALERSIWPDGVEGVEPPTRSLVDSVRSVLRVVSQLAEP